MIVANKHKLLLRFEFIEGKIKLQPPTQLIFEDRCSAALLKKEHKQLYNYLELNGAVSADRKRVQFTGLVVLGANNSYCFVPRKTLPLDVSDSDEKVQSAQLTMDVLKKFGASSQRAAIYHKEGNSGIIAPIISELAIDFREHGIYSERLRAHGINNGKINWPATIAEELPYPSNNTLVYMNFRTTSPLRSEISLLSVIQTVIIAEIYDKHYWWLKKEFGNARRPSPERVLYRREHWVTLLEKLMLRLYSSRSIHLAELLIDYLKAERDNPEGSFFAVYVIFTLYGKKCWQRPFRVLKHFGTADCQSPII